MHCYRDAANHGSLDSWPWTSLRMLEYRLSSMSGILNHISTSSEVNCGALYTFNAVSFPRVVLDHRANNLASGNCPCVHWTRKYQSRHPNVRTSLRILQPISHSLASRMVIWSYKYTIVIPLIAANLAFWGLTIACELMHFLPNAIRINHSHFS